MPITIKPRGYKYPLPIDKMEMLKDIAQFEYKLPSGTCIKFEEMDVTVFLDDICEPRKEKFSTTIEQLKSELSKLESEFKKWDTEYIRISRVLKDPSIDSRDKLREEYSVNSVWSKRDYFEKQIEIIEERITQAQMSASPYEFTVDVNVLGLYQRTLNGPEVVIYLNHITSYASLAATFVHEMFHAYFDDMCMGYDRDKYKYVEEPITEYAMIRFFEEFLKGKGSYKINIDDIKNIVEAKIGNLGTDLYGFGYKLWNYEDEKKTQYNWIESYKKAKSKIDFGSDDVRKYENPFKQGLFSYNEEEQMVLLYQILNPGKSLPTSTVPTSGVASPISSAGTPIPPTGAMPGGIIHTVLTSTTPIINKPTDISIYGTHKTSYSSDAQDAIDIITAGGAKKDITRTEVFYYFNKAKISGKDDDYYTAFVAAMMWGLINTTMSKPATSGIPHAVAAFNESKSKIIDVVKNVIMMVNRKHIAGAISYLSSGGGKIMGVGDSFFTKIMYFCDCSLSGPHSLIFDSWGQVMHIAMLIDDGDFTDLRRWYTPNSAGVISSAITINDKIYEDFIVRMEATARRYMIRSEVLEEWLFGEKRTTKFGKSSSNPRVKLLEEINKSPYKVTFK